MTPPYDGGTTYLMNSIWIAAAIASTRVGSVHAQTENAALKYMFYRLSKLLEVPATFIFVFDGPARPARKRGKQVCDKSVWLTRYLKEMLPLFGFHHHQARALVVYIWRHANWTLRLLQRRRLSWLS